MLSISGIVGGTAHGFKEFIGNIRHIITWKATVYSIGLAVLFFCFGSIIAHFPLNYRVFGLGIVSLKFSVYALWMAFTDRFLFVIIDYAASMIFIMIVEGLSRIQRDKLSGVGGKLWKYREEFDGKRWKRICGGILFSFFASLLQQMKLGLNENYFNHNDLYHLLQLVAMWLIFNGAFYLKDYNSSWIK